MSGVQWWETVFLNYYFHCSQILSKCLPSDGKHMGAVVVHSAHWTSAIHGVVDSKQNQSKKLRFKLSVV